MSEKMPMRRLKRR